MTRFRRRGHWRRGKNGTRHWVSSHTVSRDGRDSFESYPRFGTLGRTRWEEDPSPARAASVPTARTSWNPPPEDPNARCPICFEQVWFFRNRSGGCAYFDAIGKPWPLHPCMEQLQDAEDRRAAADARAAFDHALRTNSRFAARRAARGESRMSVAASVQQSEPTSDVHAPSASGASGDDEEPLDWSLVLGGLMALLLSLPVTHWLDTRFDSIPALLSFWAVHLPTLAMAIAIGWFLLRAPRPKLEGGEVLAAVVFAPLLLILGILGNVLTCGLAVPMAAPFVISEANSARRRSTG